MRSIISILIVLLSTFTSSTEKCSEEQVKRINNLTNSSLNATFNQIKEIKSISLPLRTSGKIWLSDSNQLVWQVIKPIKSTIVITEDGLSQFNRKDIKQDNAPNLIGNDLSKVFLNVASGDFKSLKNNFNMDLTCKEGSWVFKLTPRNEPLINVLTSIDIFGEQFINGFSYIEKRGDTTSIKLIPESQSFSQELSFYLPKVKSKF